MSKLKINKVKIEINTTDGLFGATHQFSTGLNIVRGNNTTGKSSLFQSIIYALGFEELLGGKFEKTLQSVLKDKVEYPRGIKDYNIIQSYIYLVIENQNNEVITIKRGVKTSERKSQLVDVYFGDYILNVEKITEEKQMWVHDKGGASDHNFGFHKFLCEFLNINLPKVLTYNGDYVNIYLQQLASTFIIEQKKGWSDYFITSPIYSIRDLHQHLIEYLLDLDVFENNEKREKLNFEKNKITKAWNKVFNDMNYLADKSNSELIGITSEPEIINDIKSIKLLYKKQDFNIKIEDYLSELNKELSTYNEEINSVGENSEKFEKELEDKQHLLNKISINYDLILPEISKEFEKLKQYNNQYTIIYDDLRKNKGIQKLNKLGSEQNIKTFENICPTCSQEIKDLLPSDINHIPMRLDDNIKYLESQLKMIEVYIQGQKALIEEKSKQSNYYKQEAQLLRTQIRSLKTELIEDSRLPSTIEIEKKFSLNQKIFFYTNTIEKFDRLLTELKPIIKDFILIESKISKLPKSKLSDSDENKIKNLESNFLDYLKKFGYTSKSPYSIKISRHNFFPIVDDLYNIKFDSSASDFIRSIWAFTISLMKTSIKYDGNHPQLLILDEPKQQDASLESFKALLSELANFKDQQVIVFASFENSDETFFESTNNIDFTLNLINETLIKPVN
ncbi:MULTISPECIES: hypothetical protein [unclassified Empedobacter]|uniref:hypothetical protein n=1 Tax=unclassified Empedobacter TaxID=2643773 RepID=UPI0025BB82EA|nr:MULTISPECIES: hypothetical protein [unclassified Empedobacter]